MTARETARSALRSATAPAHDRVDRLFSAADLGDREGYGRFLLAQAGALLPAEAALTRAGAAAVLPDWPERRRGDALLADLAALGLAPLPHAEEVPPPLAGAAAVLGAVYVLEGSRLGGRLLARGVPGHLPSAFLSGGDPGAWRRLLALIEERLAEPAERAAAVAAATATFDLFEASARRVLAA